MVPHTHWDREWYEPFQRFRLRLVALLDEVFERMDADPRQRFTLDGRLAAVHDYLEVGPEQGGRVTALAPAGRLAAGPWPEVVRLPLRAWEIATLQRRLAPLSPAQ